MTLFIDARQVPADSRIEADLCIVGAGAAGITLALQFMGRPTRVILLESGGVKPDPATQSLYKADVVGVAGQRPDLSRSRFLGGSTNCWGGWCRPLDPIDMTERSWIPNSGWPIDREDLQPYYTRTHELLKLGPFVYDEAYWSRELAGGSAEFLPLDGDRIRNVVCQLSPPARFGQLYGETLRAASNVHVYLNANVTEIVTDETGNSVTSIDVATLDGGRFRVTPKTVVLCAGGIENARLLLASNRRRRAGIGNEHDVVGRYFTDHAAMAMGKVRLANQTKHRVLYDSTLPLRRVNRRNASIAAHLAPTEKAQRENALPNSRTLLVTQYFRSMSTSYIVAQQIWKKNRYRRKFGVPFSEVIAEVRNGIPVLLRQAPQLTLALLDNRYNPTFMRRTFRVETVIEPVPNPDSRITLASTVDRLGMPKAVVDWRLTELDKRNFTKVHQLVTSELESRGLITVLDPERHVEDAWPNAVEGRWHHIGTTRMSADPKKGVVNSDCRVHGMSNLYVAGSSVFATAGSDMPTITIVALALRLAKHLQDGFAQTGVSQRQTPAAVLEPVPAG